MSKSKNELYPDGLNTKSHKVTHTTVERRSWRNGQSVPKSRFKMRQNWSPYISLFTLPFICYINALPFNSRTAHMLSQEITLTEVINIYICTDKCKSINFSSHKRIMCGSK